MAKTAAQIAERYRARVAASGQAYKDGVQNPNKSWSQGYTQSAQRMANNFAAAVAEGKPQRRVQALGDAGMIQKTIAKSDRYAQSAQRAADGYAAIAQKVIDAGNAGRQAALSISPDTHENRMQRMRANVEAIMSSWGVTPQ